MGPSYLYNGNLYSGKTPDSKIHGANIGSTWGCQDPGEPHVGHTNLAIWDTIFILTPSTDVDSVNWLQHKNWTDKEVNHLESKHCPFTMIQQNCRQITLWVNLT